MINPMAMSDADQERLEAAGIAVIEALGTSGLGDDPNAMLFVLGGTLGALAVSTDNPNGAIEAAFRVAHGVVSGELLNPAE